MTENPRQTAAINFLEEIAKLGIAENTQDLKSLYYNARSDGASSIYGAKNPVDWNRLASNYNKRYPGSSISGSDLKQIIIDLRKDRFESLGYSDLPTFGRLENETSYNGYTFDDITYGNDLPYYKENENGTPIVNTPTPDYDLSDESAREKLLNAYYRDAYDINAQGTNANQIYNQLVANNQTAAVEAARIADLNAQQAAMQQAATVKQITDQVRNERMARLRAGMSEAQIANQDMQSLMTNINALNQQANEANLARLSAQSAYNTAQADAYNAWLQQANAMATVGSANAAADAGDAINVANRLGYYSEKDKKFKTNYATGTGTTTS